MMGTGGGSPEWASRAPGVLLGGRTGGGPSVCPDRPCPARRGGPAPPTARGGFGFQPAITSYRFRPRPPRAGEIISHGDLGPWNTVYRDGIAVAFIDWDSAGPVSPLDDLADAAWTFVPLAPPGS